MTSLKEELCAVIHDGLLEYGKEILEELDKADTHYFMMLSCLEKVYNSNSFPTYNHSLSPKQNLLGIMDHARGALIYYIETDDMHVWTKWICAIDSDDPYLMAEIFLKLKRSKKFCASVHSYMRATSSRSHTAKERFKQMHVQLDLMHKK